MLQKTVGAVVQDSQLVCIGMDVCRGVWRGSLLIKDHNSHNGHQVIVVTALISTERGGTIRGDTSNLAMVTFACS